MTVYVTQILILSILSFGLALTSDLPVVEIVSWIEADDYKWKSGNEIEIKGVTHNKTTFVIPSDIHGLLIACNASYPIEWEFAPDEHLDPNLMVFSLYPIPRREGMGTPDSPFVFSLTLALFGDTNAFTGKYICKKVNSATDSYFGDIQTQIYIFWEGNSPPYIMGAGKTVKVSSHLQGSVRLPCPVSFPEVDVYLQKKINVTNKKNKTTQVKFVDLDYNSNTSAIAPITYDPTVGFILDNPMDRNKSIDGEYRCLTAEKDDTLTVIVVPEKVTELAQHPGTDRLDVGTKLYYNETSRQFTCCSNSNKAPEIYSFWCMSYAHCRIARPIIYHNMLDKIKANNVYYGRSVVGNCVSLSVYQGAYRCIGDGIDATRTIFSYYKYRNGKYKRYMFWSWQEITPAKQQTLITIYLQVQQRPNSALHLNPWFYYQAGVGHDPLLYSGQNISFTCQPANFYFADGHQWKVKWKNQTVTYIKIPLDSAQKSRSWYFTPPQSAYLIISTQMYAVTCMAPIWNSTAWVEKDYVLKTKDPILPQISSPNADNLYWTLNSTNVTIRCDATGDPIPRITWLKNGKQIMDKNVNITYVNGTLSINFLVVGFDVHGKYLCVAENIASRTEKMFSVYVEETHPWVATIIITCICLIFLTILGVLGWKLKVNHDTASELRWRTA